MSVCEVVGIGFFKSKKGQDLACIHFLQDARNVSGRAAMQQIVPDDSFSRSLQVGDLIELSYNRNGYLDEIKKV